MPNTKIAKKQGKSDVIRAQPPTMSDADVTSADSKTPATKSRATASSKTPTQLPKSKADFVRAHPNLSPKEIVEKAAAAGIKLGWRYVYNVRATDKVARKRKRAAAKGRTSTPSVTLAASSSSAEDLLRAVAAELGLGRAVEILAQERARVRAILKG
jgi:hypothetical protein